MEIDELQPGKSVYYGSHGICTVQRIETKSLGMNKVDYYVLLPISGERIELYLPVNYNSEKVKIREIQTYEGISHILNEAYKSPMEWIKDSKKRRTRFAEILKSGDTAELIRMVRAIYLYEKELPDGKNLPSSDLEPLKNAEKQLFGEFNYVLHIDQNEFHTMMTDGL